MVGRPLRTPEFCSCDRLILPQVKFSAEQVTSVEIFDGSHVHSISIASS